MKIHYFCIGKRKTIILKITLADWTNTFITCFSENKSINIAIVKDLTILNSSWCLITPLEVSSLIGLERDLGIETFETSQVTLMCSHDWKPLQKRMLLKYLSIPFLQVENCNRECTCQCKYRSRGSPKPTPCQCTVLCSMRQSTMDSQARGD